MSLYAHVRTCATCWRIREDMADSTNSKDWESTATLLRGALERVERRIRTQANDEPSSASPTGRRLASSDASSSCTPREEFRTLFGYRAGASTGKKKLKRGECSSNGAGGPKKRPRTTMTWKKETICLRFKNQDKSPDCAEKMELAKMGLSLKELFFDAEDRQCH